MKIRWGILGAANIARKNWKAIFNSGNSVVTAVASRDVRRAESFIRDCQHEAPMPVVPKAYADYRAILDSPEVDAVYIPLPTGVRKEWVIRAAEAGKHVLCEKPCARNVPDLEEMINACRKNKVQFMDGVMFMHNSRLSRLQQSVAGEIGKLRRITSAFSFVGDDEFFATNIRASQELEPFGCLGDLGWYCIRLALSVAGDVPQRVTGRALERNQSGVAIEFSGELFFNHGVSSGFYCSFLTETEQWAHISGTNGLLRIDDFVLPFYGDEVEYVASKPIFNVRGCDFRMEPHERRIAVSEYSNSDPTSQETNLFRNFAQLAAEKKLDDFWPEIALRTQRVMVACAESAAQNGREVAL